LGKKQRKYCPNLYAPESIMVQRWTNWVFGINKYS